MNLNLNELYFEYKEEVMDAIQFMKHEYPIIDKIIKRIYIGIITFWREISRIPPLISIIS